MTERGMLPAWADEASLQRQLLQALQQGRSLPLPGWQTVPGPRGLNPAAPHVAESALAIEADDGLQAYQRNAQAIADRALQAAHPVLAEMVGSEAMQALAWRLWRQRPPEHGDLAEWGQGLPDLLASVPELQDEPYLADVARLEWSVHRAATAADAPVSTGEGGWVPGLALLAEQDPQDLHLRLQPGLAVHRSAHPLWALWSAHQSPQRDQPDRFAQVRSAMARAEGQSVVVWRAGWAVRVDAMAEPDANFTLALLGGSALGIALLDAPPADFQAWLIRALGEGWLASVEAMETPR